MNPRLKLLKLHLFPPHNVQRLEFLEEKWLLERFSQIYRDWVVRVRKLSIFPFFNFAITLFLQLSEGEFQSN